MQDSLTLEMMFAELDAPSSSDASARVIAAFAVAGEAPGGWALDPPMPDPEHSDRFGIQARPATDRSLDISGAWELAHRLAATLDGGRVEPVFGGDVDIDEEPGTDGLGAAATSAVAPSEGWHVDMVNARDAWALFDDRTPGADVLVGHPDTGYTPHPELGDEAAWTAAMERGINLVERGAPPVDPLDGGLFRFPGHGTATGSIIVSHERGEIGGAPAVVGIAPGARLLPIRVARTVVTLGWTSRLATAIEHAADVGCHVVSMSLGGLPSSRLARAVRHAHAKGVIIVAAAGNVVQFPVWPANYDGVVACAACGPDRRAWAGTSKGPTVDITAPGHLVQVAAWEAGIPSTRPGSGTSFATAIVAGTAALWLSKHGPQVLRDGYPGPLLPRAFLRLVRETAGPGAHSAWHASWLGAGMLDTGKLLAADLPSLETLQAVPATRTEDDLEPLLAVAPSRRSRAEGSTAQPSEMRAGLARGLDANLRAELVFQLATDATLRTGVIESLVATARGDVALTSMPGTSSGMSPQLRGALMQRAEVRVVAAEARAIDAGAAVGDARDTELESAITADSTPDPARVAELVALGPEPGDDAWNELLAIAATRPDLIDDAVAGAPAEEAPALEARALRTDLNWARQPIVPAPAGRDEPLTVKEVEAHVRHARQLGHALRPVGRCYSDGGALGTAGLQLAMRRLTFDDGALVRRYAEGALTASARPRARHLVEVAAGARVHDVNLWLAQNGLALPMTGAFSGQTLVGAMQTSTHGTGLLHAPLCDMVRSIEIVVAREGGTERWRVERPGDPITDPARSPISVRGRAPGEADWLDALVVSLGSMAVVTSVVIETVDAFRLQQNRYTQSWKWLKSYLGIAASDTKHPIVNPRFYGFSVLINPYSGGAHGEQECVLSELVKLPGAVPGPILENRIDGGAPGGASEHGPTFLQLCVKRKEQIAARLRAFALKPPPVGSMESGWNDSWRLLSGPNDYPYGISIEYAYPLDTYVEALDAMLTRLRELYAEDKCVVGPVSLRFVGESRAMFGLSHGGDRATVEILGALGVRARPLFRCDEALDALAVVAFDPKYRGRPHWGQRQPARWRDVWERYPQARAWNAVRSAIDPGGTFGTGAGELAGEEPAS